MLKVKPAGTFVEPLVVTHATVFVAAAGSTAAVPGFGRKARAA